MYKEATMPPIEQRPAKGGSYVRHPDGSLELVDATKPAEPQLATEPKASTDALPQIPAPTASTEE